MGKREKLEGQAQEIRDRASTRVDELRTQARELRAKAEELLERAEQVRERTGDRVLDLTDRATSAAGNLSDELHERAEAKVAEHDQDEGKRKGKKGLIALLLAGLAGVAMFLKRKRERELDEALWEEPRSL